MSKPIIGVTTYQESNPQGNALIALQRAYIDVLVEAGGIPLLIPNNLAAEAIPQLVRRLDGILFTGGGDIAVHRFNGQAHPSVEGVDEERDSIELALLDHLVREKKPFLGICRGFQLINVGLGGTLYTHIEDQLPGAIKHDWHSNISRNHLAHTVSLVDGTRFRKIMGAATLSVNSLHHQGARDIAKTLISCAYAPDGLVEAVELPEHPFGIAVEWHPEWLSDQPATRRLFRSFMTAAEAAA